MENRLNKQSTPAKKCLKLLFIEDTSGSMQGERIGSVNDGLRGVLPDIQDISNKNPEARIEIGILTFGSDVVWVTPEPVAVEDFHYTNMEAFGGTPMGQAFKELDRKLSMDEFMQDPVGLYCPVIVLLSDGEPTDEYVHYLQQLQGNKFFKNATKVAVAVEGADKDVLVKFTGNLETVMDVTDSAALKKYIKFITMSSSKIGSKNQAGLTAEDRSLAVIEEVKQAIQEEAEDVYTEDDWG